MAEGLNKVILVGNLGMDPELKRTQSGQALLRMRLATTERYLPRGGSEWQERTEWHTVLVWGNRAEALSRFLSKGRTICVEGRIQYRQWEDRHQQKRVTAEVVAQNVLLLGGSRAAGGGYAEAPDPEPPPDLAVDYQDTSSAPGDDFGDDDIPF